MGEGFAIDCWKKQGIFDSFRCDFWYKKRHRVEPMACWEDRVLVDKKIVQLSKVANNGIILISCISVCYNKYPALIFCQTTWGNKV